MLGKLLPVILALFGLAAGVGAGVALKPAPAPEITNPCGDLPGETHDAEEMHEEEEEEEPTDSEFVKLENQFVVPVVEDGGVAALVVMSLTLEVAPGTSEQVMQREPKLRDRLLQVMLDHANTGGFNGTFTSNGAMEDLREALAEAARRDNIESVRDILIVDINRQDR